MKQMIFLLVIFIAACAPISPISSSTPSPIPVRTEMVGTVNPTAVSVMNTPTPESSSGDNSSPFISYLKMVDSHNGWALATGKESLRNYVLRTVDGGATWQDVTPPQLITVRNHTYWFSGSLSAVDAETAWAIANGGESLIGTVWRTDDGGLSWRPGNPIRIYPPGSEMFINGFDTNLNFIDAQNGWLSVRVQGVMAHYIDTWFRTADGGLNWERVPICRYEADAGCNYLFLDELTGFKNSFDRYISGVSDIETSTIWQIEKTVDGGLTWSNVVLSPPADLISNLFSREAIQPSQVINFSVGQSFTQFKSGTIGVRMDFVAYTANDDFAHPSLNKGYFYISNDAGKTWQYFPFSGDLFFLTDLVGWRFTKQGDKYIFEKTVDGGATWISVGGEILDSGRIQFIDENSGWMLVQKRDFTSSLMQTVDGGQTWQDITANILEPLLSKDFLNLPSVTSPPVSEEPWIARMDSGSPLELETIHMSNADNGWGTSLNGYIFHTTDGGNTWRDVTPQYGTVNRENDFFALDALHALTVITPLPICIEAAPTAHCPDYYLSRGPVWYTDDGGKTWNPGGAFPDPERSFEIEPIKIQFANASMGWASWLSRKPNEDYPTYHLIKTMDGGLTWQPFLTEPYQGEIRFLNENVGFRTEKYHLSVNTMDEFMKGSALPVLNKTTDGGMTWEPVILSDFIFNLEKVPLDQNTLSPFSTFCDYPEISFFGEHGVGIKYSCWISEVTKFYEYYYSPDEGQSWNNWVSSEYKLSMDNQAKWNEWMLGAFEFFLDNGIGWRLYRSRPDSAAQLQHTAHAGKSWETIKTVAWQEVKFDFVDEQEGWAIIVNYDDVVLVHTVDGGKSWEELKPIVDNG